MSFKSIFSMAVLLLAIVNLIEAREVKTFPIKNEKPIYETDSLRSKQVIPLKTDFVTESPGTVVGTTYYDLQSLSSSGNRIAVCSDGSRYFAWTNGLNYPTPRHVYFNYIDATGEWYSEGWGEQVNRDVGSGFAQLSLIDSNRAAIAYYSPQRANPTYATLAIEPYPPGFGLFDYYDPPDSFETGGRGLWPYIAVSRNNDLNILMTRSQPDDPIMQLYLTRSIDWGYSWWPNNTYPAFVDTIMRPASVIAASPVSNKIVIVYLKPAKTFVSVFNDVAYIVSENGYDWNFNDINMVTDYGHDPDSLWACGDLDVIIDNNDNIHIAWNAQWITNAGIYVKTSLYHYSSLNDQIAVIAEHPNETWPDSGCDWGAWNRPMCKMSMGLFQSDYYSDGLFIVWTQFDPWDCSAGGYANGDIYMTGKYIDGNQWFYPMNLTNSFSPDCLPGDCDNDNWATLADYVDYSLHIFYENDKDAGSAVLGEGEVCDNRLLYLEQYNPFAIDLGIMNSANANSINSIQSYPNPFNTQATISFELKQESPVKLDIFDITGRKVASLLDKNMAAGHHRIVWDASKYASGVYYYRFSSDEKSIIKQMVLVK